jgi:hypothetical protein
LRAEVEATRRKSIFDKSVLARKHTDAAVDASQQSTSRTEYNVDPSGPEISITSTSDDSTSTAQRNIQTTPKRAPLPFNEHKDRAIRYGLHAVLQQEAAKHTHSLSLSSSQSPRNAIVVRNVSNLPTTSRDAATHTGVSSSTAQTASTNPPSGQGDLDVAPSGLCDSSETVSRAPHSPPVLGSILDYSSDSDD